MTTQVAIAFWSGVFFGMAFAILAFYFFSTMEIVQSQREQRTAEDRAAVPFERHFWWVFFRKPEWETLYD